MGKERKRLRGDYHGYLNGSEKFGFDNKYSIKDGVLFVEVIFKDSLNIYEFDIDFLKTLQSLNVRLMCDSRGYCYITLPKSNKYNISNRRQIFIHNIILFGLDYYIQNMSKTVIVDHIDTNIFNNKKENLRGTDNSGNAKNADIRKDSTTKVKGLNIHKNRKSVSIQVRVQHDEKRIGKSFNFSLKGLQEAVDWLYKTRNELHGQFSNHGSKYIGMTEEEIKEDMVKTFIENIPEEYIDIFNKNIK